MMYGWSLVSGAEHSGTWRMVVVTQSKSTKQAHCVDWQIGGIHYRGVKSSVTNHDQGTCLPEIFSKAILEIVPWWNQIIQVYCNTYMIIFSYIFLHHICLVILYRIIIYIMYFLYDVKQNTHQKMYTD